jgi:hypothetical protein
MTGKQTNKNNNHIHSQNGYHPKRHPKHECSYRKTMMNVFEFLNTNGLRIFGFSGQEGNFIKTLMEKSDVWLVELNNEIAQGEESKRILNLDKKVVSVIEACRQMVTDHKTGVLMALNAHFPQDIVREIAQNYV